MSVAALVLHHRFWPGIEPCLERLRAQTHRLERVVVVDNCSGDGSVDAIRRACPWAEVLECPFNGGYAAGMNAGLRFLEQQGPAPEAVLFMTHDAWLAPDCLEALARRLDGGGDVGAVGPLLGLHDQGERVYSAGGLIDTASDWAIGHMSDPLLPMMSDWAEGHPRSVMWLDGACMLVRRQALRQVGPLDERYFLYYEDVDYGIRLRAAGWSIECVPDARAWHRHAQPAPLLEYLDSRNKLVLVFSHAPVHVQLGATARALVAVARDATSGSPPGRASRARPRWQGMVDFCLGRLGPPRQGLTWAPPVRALGPPR